MAIRKSISFFAPYIVNELNQHIDDIAGGDALLYGGEITVQTATTVDIAPYIFVQDGVTVFKDDVTAAVVVPDYAVFTKPVHILVSSPDSKDTSGVLISVAEGNEDVDDNAIVIATRVRNLWFNPPKPSLFELRASSLLPRADSVPGRVEDAGLEFDDGYKGWGTNQAVHLKQGTISDSAGTREELVTDLGLAEGDSAIEFDVQNIDPDFYRNDYIVVRRTSDSLNVPPSIVYAQGDTFLQAQDRFWEPPTTPIRTIHTAAGNTQPSVSYNAAGEHVVVHGNASNLYHSKLDHTATRAVGVGPTATAAGAAVSDVFIAERKGIKSGDRLFGCCVVGTEIAIFRTTADGAAIGGGDIDVFTSMTNTPAKPHMVITGEGTAGKPLYAHIVFQHPEGAPNNQIYYTKYALADATWGTAGAVAVQPRILRGFNGGLNHTDPSVAAHPNGNLYISYVHAAGSGTVGEIRYLVINQAGEVEQVETALSGNVSDGVGGTLTVTALEKPKTVISPQGTVYIVYMDNSSAVFTGPTVLAWEESILGRVGYGSVPLYDFGSSFNSIWWHSSFADDLGNLCCLCAVEYTGPVQRWYFLKFQPVLSSDGLNIAPDNLNLEYGTNFLGFRPGSSTGDETGEAILDRDGSLSIVDLVSTAVKHHKFSSQTYNKPFVEKKKIHPRDTYLGSISVPPGASDSVGTGSVVMTHPRRIKTIPPFKTVGLNGDEGTFSGLQDAIWSLHGTGGKVVIRGGEYYLENSYLEVLSGVEVIGDGHVVLFVEGAGIRIQNVPPRTISTLDATRRIYQTGSGDLLRWLRQGDVFYIFDNTVVPSLHKTASVFGPGTVHKVLDDDKVQLSTDVSALISLIGAGASIAFFASGVQMRNLTFFDNRGTNTTPMLQVYRGYHGIYKDLYVTNASTPTTATVFQRMCVGNIYENIRILGQGTSDTDFRVDGGPEISDYRTTLKNVQCSGEIEFATTVKCEDLRISACKAANFVVGAAFDEAPPWVDNDGPISGGLSTFDSVTTWAGGGTAFAERIVGKGDVVTATGGVPDESDAAMTIRKPSWGTDASQPGILQWSDYFAALYSSFGVKLSVEDIFNPGDYFIILQEPVSWAGGASTTCTLTRTAAPAGTDTQALSEGTLAYVQNSSNTSEVPNGIYFVNSIPSSTTITLVKLSASAFTTVGPTAATTANIDFISGSLLGSSFQNRPAWFTTIGGGSAQVGVRFSGNSNQGGNILECDNEAASEMTVSQSCQIRYSGGTLNPLDSGLTIAKQIPLCSGSSTGTSPDFILKQTLALAGVLESQTGGTDSFYIPLDLPHGSDINAVYVDWHAPSTNGALGLELYSRVWGAATAVSHGSITNTTLIREFPALAPSPAINFVDKFNQYFIVLRNFGGFALDLIYGIYVQFNDVYVQGL